MKKLLGLFVALLSVFVIAACGQSDSSESGVDSEGSEGSEGSEASETTESSDSYSVALIPKGIGNEFWEVMHNGAKEAAEQIEADEGIKINVEYKATASESDINGQISLVEDFITKGVDAINIVPQDSKALYPVLEKAQEQGIKVVMIDSQTDPEIYPYIATDNIEGGRLAAQEANEVTGGEGKVALLPFLAGASASIERIQGFEEELENYPGLEVVASEYTESDVNIAMNVTENILTAHPDLAVIYATSPQSAIGAQQAVNSSGLTEQVKIIGFDTSDKQIEGVQDGSMHAMIAQNPFKMGYEGILRSLKLLQGETVKDYLDTGVTIITKENIDDPEIQELINP